MKKKKIWLKKNLGKKNLVKKKFWVKKKILHKTILAQSKFEAKRLKIALFRTTAPSGIQNCPIPTGPFWDRN